MNKKHWPGMIGMLVATLPIMASADDIPLVQDNVCRYMNTRIETNLLQEEFRRNADQYDDVPRAFFTARNVLLRERGWTVEEFEAIQRRILDAGSALDEQEKFAARADQRAEEKAAIRGNAYLPDEQKQQMLDMQDKLYEAEKANIDRSRPDWPAVRPHREALDMLMAWIADNTPKPPEKCRD
jgi:hypothetical protein